jgi:hypothetical protein
MEDRSERYDILVVIAGVERGWEKGSMDQIRRQQKL